jgi:hypothetical protein
MRSSKCSSESWSVAQSFPVWLQLRVGAPLRSVWLPGLLKIKIRDVYVNVCQTSSASKPWCNAIPLMIAVAVAVAVTVAVAVAVAVTVAVAVAVAVAIAVYTVYAHKCPLFIFS